MHPMDLRSLFTICIFVLEYSCGAQSAQALSLAQPLPLPSEPEKVCTAATFREATSKEPVCGEKMYNYKSPDTRCCTALQVYYADNSTKPSRNCFCVEPYFTRLTELDEVTYIDLAKNLDFCGIAYYQAGEGPCAGLSATDTASSASSSAKPGRSVRKWIKDLNGDGLMTLSFTMGLISVFGFFAMLWPLVTDTVLEIYKRRAARRTST